MGVGRRRALENLNELSPELETHIRKLLEDPGNTSAAHWDAEVRAFLGKMLRVLPEVGRRTRQFWQQRLDGREARLESRHDNTLP